MNLEQNPFQLLIPIAGQISSITLVSNLDWLDLSEGAVTGSDVFLPISSRTDLTGNQVFATPAGGGTAEMLTLTTTHIPTLPISHIAGLQSAINSIVKTLSTTSPAFSVTPNGSGDYAIAPVFGSSANTIAQGNDTRFPASVTGLRKSAGAGSTDTAATVKVDYWNADVFVASGASHAKGLVPDPGASAGATRYLNEDGTFKVPAGSGTVTNVATTFPVTGGPITSTGTIALAISADFGFTAPQSISILDAADTTPTTLLTLSHNVSPAGAAGLGTTLLLRGKSSTTNNQNMGSVQTVWNDATHATRTANMNFSLVNSGAAIDVKMRLFGSGGLSILSPYSDPGSGIMAASNYYVNAVAGNQIVKTDGSKFLTSAIAKTDYWDTSDFVSVGVSHDKGLVPDPGAGSYTGRVLHEDATWRLFTPAIGTLTNSMLAVMAANTIKGNATGSSASPTDINAKTARSSSLLNLESVTTHGNSDYTILATDRYVATSATITTPRTWTLPLANSFNPGQTLTISDDFGGVTSSNTILIKRAGADVIQGSSNDLVLNQKYASVTLSSDGASKWFVVGMRPAIKKKFYLGNTTYTTPTGVKMLFVQCIGGGGGGAGAVASASNASAGGGGASGGYTEILISAPLSSYAVTVGAGGAGGVGANPGGTGGDTEFAAVCLSAGGGGGVNMSGGTTPAFSAGGFCFGGSLGDFFLEGSDGGTGIRLSGTVAASGTGGAAPFVGGTRGSTIVQNDGLLACRYGSGGSGATSLNATPQTGGGGTQGIVFVTEYY